VAEKDEKAFRKALMEMMPLQCKNKKIWLPSDSVMVCDKKFYYVVI